MAETREGFDYAKMLNIPANAVLPFNPLRNQLLLGSAEYIAIEAVVSRLFRILLKLPQKSWTELLGVHAISMAYMGGAGAFAGETKNLDAPLSEQFKDGAKGIPAILLAKATYDTLNRGFHVPKWSFSDVMISAAAKAISRPIFSLLYPFVKSTRAISRPLETVNQMVNKQVRRSNLKSS